MIKKLLNNKFKLLILLIILIPTTTFTQDNLYGELFFIETNNQNKNSVIKLEYGQIIDDNLLNTNIISIQYLKSYNNLFSYGAHIALNNTSLTSTGNQLEQNLIDNHIEQIVNKPTASLLFIGSLSLIKGKMSSLNTFFFNSEININFGLGSTYYKDKNLNKKSWTQTIMTGISVDFDLSKHYLLFFDFKRFFDSYTNDSNFSYNILGIGLGKRW